MAKLKLPAFNEGTLLQRTLLYVGTFVVGSIGFVALSSLLVVWIAKSVLPSPRGEASEDGADKPAEVAAASPAKPTGKIPRPKRSKSAVAAPVEPPAEATP